MAQRRATPWQFERQVGSRKKVVVRPQAPRSNASRELVD
jgi:hypothetical protein